MTRETVTNLKQDKANDSRPHRYLKTREAANYLGISVHTLRRLRCRRPGDPGGPGPDFKKVTDQIFLYSVDALEEWVSQRASRAERAA